MSLKDAREARDDARKLRKGTDPAQQRQLDKLTCQAVAGITFEAVAREAARHQAQRLEPALRRALDRACMESDLFPWIGSLPLQDITAPLLLHTLRRIEIPQRGAHETAHIATDGRARCSATASPPADANANPAPDLHGALKPIVVKHCPRCSTTGATALMRAIAAYEGRR